MSETQERRNIALLSVYDKTGIVEFAQGLVNLGWDIISSGGTYKVLTAAEVPAQDVSEVTGFKPILGHRVVTLNPIIHGGLLATEAMRQELADLKFPWIDLVCVDLYPLEASIEATGATLESVNEQTDIGGPTMIRSAMKGGRIVICDPGDRDAVLDWLEDDSPGKEEVVPLLGAKAEAVLARYSALSALFRAGNEIDQEYGGPVITALDAVIDAINKKLDDSPLCSVE